MHKYLIILALLWACKPVNPGPAQLGSEGLKQNSTEQSQAQSGVFKDLSLSEFNQLYSQESKSTAMLLDLRTPPEFNDGYIKGAVMINFLEDDIDSQLNKLDKTKKYFIYCQQGARSSRCMEKMKGMGFTQVYNLLDGYAGYLTRMN